MNDVLVDLLERTYAGPPNAKRRASEEARA
jgi:hypothetical protein